MSEFQKRRILLDLRLLYGSGIRTCDLQCQISHTDTLALSNPILYEQQDAQHLLDMNQTVIIHEWQLTHLITFYKSIETGFFVTLILC